MDISSEYLLDRFVEMKHDQDDLRRRINSIFFITFFMITFELRGTVNILERSIAVNDRVNLKPTLIA